MAPAHIDLHAFNTGDYARAARAWHMQQVDFAGQAHLIKVSDEDLRLLYPGVEPHGIAERWLGGFEGEVDDGEEWDRIIILGQWQGCWFAAALLVDGNGAPRLVAGRRNLGSEAAAWRTYRQWR